MAKNKLPVDNPQGLMGLLDQILSGDGKAGGLDYKLDAGLVAEIEANHADLETNHSAVVTSEGTKEEQVGAGNAMRAVAVDLIARTKVYLFSRLPDGRKDKRLQEYLLKGRIARSFNGLLDTLQAIVVANGIYAAEEWALPAGLSANVVATADAMEAKRIAIQDAKGVYAEAIQTRGTAMEASLKDIRKVRDYLYAMLPEGKKDKLLLEYGLDVVD